MRMFDLFVRMLREGANMDEIDFVVSEMKLEIAEMKIAENSFVRLIGRKSSAEVLEPVLVIAATLQSFAMQEKLPELLIAITAYLRQEPELLDALMVPMEPMECPVPKVKAGRPRKTTPVE